ncbi:MAG: ornithine cyclodeaminase family protein [Chloroflexi bacterium]|jgi:ornithine cyclodeaminase|nr:ornithine cyclodeaminase family protein [Chloroflexota bacterium]
MTLLLGRDDVAALLDPDATINAVAAACVAASQGRTETPLRAAVSAPGGDGVLLAMPGSMRDPAVLGTKVVTVFGANAARGLPRVASLYVLADPETGMPEAVMDGTAITAARTAAASAVATRHLARGDARTLGVFGTGVQARAHVTMIARVRRLEEVLVSGRTDEASLRFAAWVASEFGLPARAASAADVALADVVACCTTSAVPLFGRVSPGAHVNAVGAFTPASREVPTDVVVGAAVYVDSREGAFAEAGDLLIPVAEGRFDLGRVVGEVGEVIAGAAPARQALPPGAVTFYKSVGAAFLDAATARMVVNRARARGVGQNFAFL